MSLYPKFRDVHLWVGLIVLIPMGLIAATGVMLNHERLLGLKPQYMKKEKKDKATEMAASPENETKYREKKAASSPSSLLAKQNSWQAHGEQVNLAIAEGVKIWGEVPLERMEIKNEPGYGMVVKLKVDRAAQTGPEEIVWSMSEQAVVEKKGDPKAGMSWQKVVHDLHTGKIFSHDYGYFWSDVAGFAILLLGGTGVVLYVIPLVKKFGKKKVPAKTAAKTPAGNPAIHPALLAKRAGKPAVPETKIAEQEVVASETRELEVTAS
ncbi:hypothetical protein ETAA8_35100 [Anatilimnocola aggregata]|uniref:PepSY domain-containing protein n=1 Tax=Anatilimnocola aggregata TaxID=2528021 RepID=A0A517YDW2_9BACT|nr:PepSY-associated TM helix domain-containing protein [Anatilimnocola aggregata]QDU28410.1 hypothetical protein ETAA8_35100 [Anatilimnocola aggregata]